MLRVISLIVAAALVLGGCGYRPLYGDRGAAGTGVRQNLAQVKIMGIADHRGQILRNNLLDRMNPAGEPAQSRYTLSVVTSETTRVTDSRADGTATRSDLVVVARFTLRDTNTDAVVYNDRTEAVATFNLLTNRFASVSSEDEARRRAMEAVADQITTLVALFVNRRHGQTSLLPQAAAE